MVFPEDLKPAGTETLNGKICTVIAVEEEGEVVARIWVSEETGLKLREEYMYVQGTPKAVIEYNYITIDGPIDDSVFELPAGMTIEEMDW